MDIGLCALDEKWDESFKKFSLKLHGMTCNSVAYVFALLLLLGNLSAGNHIPGCAMVGKGVSTSYHLKWQRHQMRESASLEQPVR
eukprot:SAG31_NODE_6748_length_1901_cov_5.280799_2_plen_85_part_00